MKQLIENIKHGPSTGIGLFLLVLSGATQIPGFQALCALSPAAGTIITYLSGLAGLVLVLAVGQQK